MVNLERGVCHEATVSSYVDLGGTGGACRTEQNGQDEREAILVRTSLASLRCWPIRACVDGCRYGRGDGGDASND